MPVAETVAAVRGMRISDHMDRYCKLTLDAMADCGQLLSRVPEPAFLFMITSMFCLWIFLCHSIW
jgi:hypothetical protein